MRFFGWLPIFLILCLFSSQVFAKNAGKKRRNNSVRLVQNDEGQDEEQTKEVKKGKNKISRDEDSSEYNGMDKTSSEYLRKDKKYLLMGELGYSTYPIFGAGVLGGYYLDPNSLVEGNYNTGEENIYILFANIKIYAKSASLRFKRFWGNSFYTNTGLAYREIGVGVSLEPLTGSDKLEAHSSTKNLGIDFAIGNRWQWESFTMGCDWVGVFVPVAKISENVYIPEDATEQEKKDYKKTWEGISKTTSLQLLRLQLGVSF